MSVNGHLRGIDRSFWGGRALVTLLVLSALLALAVTGSLATPAVAGTFPEPTYSEEEIAFVDLLNEYRAQKGLQPLLISDTISKASDAHSSDMGENAYFSHRSRTNDYFWTGAVFYERMNAVGYGYDTCKGEVICAGLRFSSAEKALETFRRSPSHHKRLLDADYRVVGVSQIYFPNDPKRLYYYWTVDFGGYVDVTAHATDIRSTLEDIAFSRYWLW